MIATTRQCLTFDELQSLLSGNSDEMQFEAAIEHLDGCTTCQSKAAESESQPSKSNEFKHLVNENVSIESACQVAMLRLLGTTPSEVAETVSTPSIEKQLGPYTILGAIGAGGMGMVYLAQHDRLKRKCAIKFLPRTRVTDAGWLERFDREMTTIAALEHPNIVRATDAGHEDGWHYLVMEYLDGLDVGKIASRLKQIGVADACRIISEAALGLAYVHKQGLVHRDIKPSNLMLTSKGDVKLLDLGLVLAGDDPLAVHDRLTTAGHFMGTMPFMSPEQLLDSRHVDPASDVYSLGATLYRLIAGRVPHTNRHGLASQVLAITNETPPPLHESVPGIDRELSNFVARLLSHEPTQRPSAEDTAEQLRQWSVDADLVRLVHRALKQPDIERQDAISWDVPSKTVAAQPRRTWPRWIAVSLAAASFLVAGVIFKIQTEKGELVIESEADNVTVLVKQGDTMIDQLEIQRGNNNRVSLRQGTYTIEIDGVSNGLRLANDRVVIQGGQQAKLALSEQVPAPMEVSDHPIVPEQSSEKVATALSYKPLYTRADITIPSAEESLKCSIQVVKTPQYVGFELLDSSGNTLRLFVDSNSDRKIDRWCYFKDGREVYRDIDSDGNGISDQALVLQKEGEVQWGLDIDEDRRFEKWVKRELAEGESLPSVDERFAPVSRSVTEKSSSTDLQRTYEGHPYSYWLDILSREQDATTLSSAMRAVEILTRETPRRREAAQATMKLAEQLGGMVIGGGDNQSSTYMEALRDVFPRYLPEPGLDCVIEALQSDDTESHMAASWMLRDYLSGYWNGDPSPERVEAARKFIKTHASNEEQPGTKVRRLMTAIEHAYKSISSKSPQPQLAYVAVQAMFNSASELTELAEPAVEIPSWMVKHVQQQADEATKALDGDSEGIRLSGEAVWRLPKNLVTTAIQLQKERRVNVSPKLIATILVYPIFEGSENERIKLLEQFNEVFEGGADETRQQLRKRIGKIITFDLDDEQHGILYDGVFGGNSKAPSSQIHRLLLTKQEFWEFAFELLANDSSTAAGSLDALKALANAKDQNSDEPLVPEKLRTSLDEAVKKLESRL